MVSKLLPALRAALCFVGGITGFARTRSVPSLVAGVSVGSLYAWSGFAIQRGDLNAGFKGALAASALLFVSSIPRVSKGPVPLTLTVTSAAASLYYGKTVYDFAL
ncbi:hypothetical protein BOTBODRAFT_184794 [Botryobasidium botryosum FD-172 SS1]|uniref:Transmembrane protein 14C n=1 Tax=Botryobasidium botryosum (strain FD-172 SS1) TaxID=930990 RepID=A0A067MTB6_BOTB1|nr:hypothetical protein BOTBODRAFT_184794 [Botryobasidium botryosum FD-172 SS1]